MFKLIFKKFLYYLIYLIDTYQHKDLNKKDKLIKTINLQGKLKSDIGRIETKQIHLTKPFKIYELITDNNKLYCADEHIVFLESGEEIYVKDLANGMLIKSYKGLDVVVSIKELGLSNYMYDVSVETPNRYFTNGILSHNTICSSIFMLWYITFEVDKNIMIVANKGDTVNEIINKVKDIYKHLPFFIKTGVSI
jgi:intein/homing endonuclease